MIKEIKREYKYGKPTGLFTPILIACCVLSTYAGYQSRVTYDDDIEPISVISTAQAQEVIAPLPPKLPDWRVKQPFVSFKKAQRCLVENVFFEARGTDKAEMQRVINVTMNRVKSNTYPNRVCEVVWQSHQFSWTLNKNFRLEHYLKNLNKPQKDALAVAIELSNKALTNKLPDITKGAKYYHTYAVNPKWNKNKTVKVASNWHKFY